MMCDDCKVRINMKLIENAVKNQIRNDLPAFGTGDNIDVHVRVIEGDKERVQIFSGTVIQRRGSGVSATSPSGSPGTRRAVRWLLSHMRCTLA